MELQKNDIIELKITSLTNEGMGIGRYKSKENDSENDKGFVVFVPFTAPNDIIKARILKITSSHAYGKIEEMIKPSGERVNSDCDIFTKCGGCDFRHISYETEIYSKSIFIRDAFSKIAKLNPVFLPVIPNENNRRYRNKAQYPVGKNEDGKIIYGFYRSNSHDIVPCSDCMLHPEIFKEIMDFIVDFADKLGVSVYDEESGQGVLRHVCIRRAFYTGEILVTFVAKRKIPELRKIANRVRVKFPQIKGVILNINKEKTNVIYGEEETILDGAAYIFDKMCGLTVRVSSTSFYQVNTVVAEKLYGIIKEFAQPKGKIIFDLYCGIGVIGLSMANEAEKIIGAEISKESVRNAIFNTTANTIKNAKFICLDAEQAVKKLLDEGVSPDVVILDPSRKGCEGDTVKNVAALQPEKIVMASCNPATAARDCGMFAEYGYVTEKVQGVDMFGGTSHVECVVLITRKNC